MPGVLGDVMGDFSERADIFDGFASSNIFRLKNIDIAVIIRLYRFPEDETPDNLPNIFYKHETTLLQIIKNVNPLYPQLTFFTKNDKHLRKRLAGYGDSSPMNELWLADSVKM